MLNSIPENTIFSGVVNEWNKFVTDIVTLLICYEDLALKMYFVTLHWILLGQLQEKPTALMTAFVINQINPNTGRCQGLRKDHLDLNKFPCVEIGFEIFKEK